MEKRILKNKTASGELTQAYLMLLHEFPLRPIKTRADYARAVNLVRRLAMQEGWLDADAEAYLEVLEGLVERYDADNNPIPDDLTPTRALQVLVEQAGMTVSDLGEVVGSKGAASELLSGKRKEPSKAQIAALCARFKVDAGTFLLPIKLAGGRTKRPAMRTPNRLR